MAPASRPAPGSLSQRLRAEPQAFEWLQALLLLQRERPQATPLGQGSQPATEALRLRGTLAAVFEPSQIAALHEDTQAQVKGRPAAITVETPMFGLGGADGALPYAYQEWLRQQTRQKDHAPAEFLDIFQHRLLSLLYRTLCKHRLALGFQPPSRAALDQPLRALAGLLPFPRRTHGPCPDSLVLARAAAFSGKRRPLAVFAAIIQRQFSVPAHCQAYAGTWREIPAASRSRLQRGAGNLRLGHNAVAGYRAWDEQAGFHLQLGPLQAEQARAFLPGGSAHATLAALHEHYLGADLDCRLELIVRPQGPLHLGHQQGARLGRNTGLRRDAQKAPEQRIRLHLRKTEAG
ncbi:type VI secretion system baseplate subunit TssG [Stutzerimonas kirkiae]|uniref:type VI secretion system baseplate subunit TssG n=1 Tax=Stutzerimonas kirkiae TaxID=2211392 RepID=UPI0010383DD2|nr:type VI secretion system baseplate subunit TssG [Stutzerimonas kirkiae]TBV14697.1 type VI secretion system baseplate subunit TssG [Stutzerimonas kirkiae]